MFYRNQGGADAWGQVAGITATDGLGSDNFGSSVSVSGDTVIVGAGGVNINEGAAYVFYRNQGGADTWGQIAKLTADNSVVGDHFGESVSVSGDTAIIGAWGADVGDNYTAGAAHIFSRDQGGNDAWGQVTKLTADNTGRESFGISVSVQDDIAVVGENDSESSNHFRGAAYVFYRNLGGSDAWGQVTKLTASDGSDEDEFGASISLSDHTAVIGARKAYWGSEYAHGAAYVFASTDCTPLTDVSIAGPIGVTSTLYIGADYHFQGVTTPTSATLPITYTWMPAPVSGQGTAETVYRWTTPGTYTVTLTVANCPPLLTVLKATRQVVIKRQELSHPIYLPLVIRDYPPNTPPNMSSSPIPDDDATNQGIYSTILSWEGGDPNAGDRVTYDVYFEVDNASPAILRSDNQSDTHYDPGTLAPNTHYYWKIVAQDNRGAITEGPVWNFTTGAAPPPSETVFVPAGEFQMGCDPAHNGGFSCESHELPLHTVYLDAYTIEKYEVTNAQYRACVNAGVCNWPAYNYSYTRPAYFDNPIYNQYPVIYVSWTDANTYCAWMGKRLPTEAEWEKAARGTTVRAYPWGDTAPDCSRVNYASSWSNACVGDTSQVGNYLTGASPYSALDMTGNVWEWVNDWYDASYYGSSPYANPQGPASGVHRVLRGGGYLNDAMHIRTALRLGSGATYRGEGLGFRCARTSGQ
ncbi:MAG: SUMF1/EgtB/PvdO family nonheme iron enzyme [Anaerolineae bacterium]|nr:SUMF1/EgtB/PvdO family nonheme iron enzyme [Anaerolineae bacterium]